MIHFFFNTVFKNNPINIFLIPEYKKIEFIKFKISIKEKLVIKKGLLNKININECGFNFQKKKMKSLQYKE